MSDRALVSTQKQATTRVTPAASGFLQRKCACGNHTMSGECEECKSKQGMLQRASFSGRGRGTEGEGEVPSIVPEVLQSPGQPLDPATRAFMEPRFGYDFSQVRVHTGPAAEAAAAAVGALAFTIGHDVVFGAGRYAPRTHAGKELLAHEMTHVLQQASALARPPSMQIVPPGHALETEAENSAREIIDGRRASPEPLNITSIAVAPQLARARFAVGNAAVEIDYGNIISIAAADYESAIETRFASWSGSPASTIHAGLTALSTPQKEWVLFALDLLVDNPVAGLDKDKAVERLIAYAPSARFRALGGRLGDFTFENEALTVSGWFEHALTASLSAPTGARLREAQRLLNPSNGGGGSSSCPSPRPAAQQLDEAKLRSDLPPLLESYLRNIAPPATGVQTQTIATLRPIADSVQNEAIRFFAPYADRGRGRGNTFLQQWIYSAHLTESTSPTVAPDLDKRLDYLTSRANLVGGQGLFSQVHFDPRCTADAAVLDQVMRNMESQSSISALVNSILQAISYTVQTATPKEVALKVQFQGDECEARWRTINSLCHELVHVMVHEDFAAQQSGRQILREGFTEILGDQLYAHLRNQANQDAALKRRFEMGLASAPCSSTPSAETGYGAAGQNADRIRVLVGNDRFRAAYFLGQVELVGIQPKRARGGAVGRSENESFEKEADRSAEIVMRQFDGAEWRKNWVAIPRHVRAQFALATTPRFMADVLGSPGQPLDPATRAFMEPRFNYDFSQVRVHTDAKATESARAVNALAYAVGQDIVFNQGQYAPGTSHGDRLLAHELTHVLQQDESSSIEHAIIQRKKDKPKGEEKAGKSKGPVRLYEHRHGDYLITKYSVKGIEFFVGVGESMIGNTEGNLDAISTAIVSANKWISDPAFKVRTCIIAPATTRYATYQDKPVLVLDPQNADSETATHEMGHAIFEESLKTSGKPKSKTKDVAIIISDIYLRLFGTKVVKDAERDASGKREQKEHPAGLWIADPSQWSTTLASEHPWDTADEFFASAREAYLLDQKGFKAAIDKFTKLDPDVKAPAQELLAALSRLAAGKIPKAPKTVSAGAAGELGRIPETTKVEDTLGSPLNEVLRWTLDPSTIPQPKPVGPSLKPPEPD